MSYAVIHMKKLKMGSIKGIENHNERLKKSRTNPDIDYGKSHLNKSLIGSDDRTYYKRIKERIEDLNLKKAVRKDAVVACGFVCTSDKSFFGDLSKKEQLKFFENSHNFLKNRYGEENVIASNVHFDETTPHLHTYIVPVKDGRLSAKSLFDRKELRNLQDEYYKFIKEQGFNLNRGKRNSENKHLDTKAYKEYTKYKSLEDTLDRLKDLEMPIEKIQKIKDKNNLFGNKKIIKNENFEDLKNMAINYYAMKRDYYLMKEKYKKMKDTKESDVSYLSEENYSLEKQNNELKKEYENWKDRVHYYLKSTDQVEKFRSFFNEIDKKNRIMNLSNLKNSYNGLVKKVNNDSITQAEYKVYENIDEVLINIAEIKRKQEYYGESKKADRDFFVLAKEIDNMSQEDLLQEATFEQINDKLSEIGKHIAKNVKSKNKPNMSLENDNEMER